MDKLLENITAPSLSSGSYGTDIDAAFANIDKNFKTIGNYDFVKGQQGNSIHIEYVNIKKTVSDPSNSMEVLGNDLYKALTKSIEKFICDYNNISSAGSGSGGFTDAEVIANSLRPIGVYNWDSWVDDVRVPLIVAENTINKTKEYMCSAAVVLFSDARFSSASLGKNYSKFTSDMIDTTCYINFIRNEYTNDWECQINTNYPRLKFKNNTFYWEVDGSETTIRSTGVQGENGKDGNTFICKYHTNDPDGIFKDKAVLQISYILRSDGSDWDNIDNVDIFDGAPVIVHLTYQKPGETDTTYWGYITSHIQITETGTGKQGTVMYLENTVNKLTWIKGASHDVFSILGTNGLEIDSTKTPLDAMPGMFVRMNVGTSSTDPTYAHCIYSINESDSSKSDGKTTLMISPKKDYYKPITNGNSAGCKLKIEYPTEITTNGEFGGIILKDKNNSTSAESKIEINQNNGTSSCIQISSTSTPINISTYNTADINIAADGNTNITSSVNTNITSDSTYIKSYKDTKIESVDANITSIKSTIIKTGNNTITCGASGVAIIGDNPITISETTNGVTDKIVIENHQIIMNTQNSSGNGYNYITVNSNKTKSPGISLNTSKGNIVMTSNDGYVSIEGLSTETSPTAVKLRCNANDKLLVNNTNVTLKNIPLITPAIQYPFGFFSDLQPTKPGHPSGSLSATTEQAIEIAWSDICKDFYSVGNTGYTYGKMSVNVNILASEGNKDKNITINIKNAPGASTFILGLRVKNTSSDYQYNATFTLKMNGHTVYYNKTAIDKDVEIWKYMYMLCIDGARAPEILGGYER